MRHRRIDGIEHRVHRGIRHILWVEAGGEIDEHMRRR
jgi:hypothetical protein